MRHAMVCDIGKERRINQDAVFSANCKDAGLFVVADGMGGHSQGEKASQWIIQKMAEWWNAFQPEKYGDDFVRMMNSLEQTAEQANRDIYQNYNKEVVCGSTMVLLFIYKDAYGMIFAGDSRIYLYHRWRLRQLTVDEVWENQPDLTQWERENNWDQYHGKLYNAVGTKEVLRCNVITGKLQSGMAFLLCSDGLYKYCPQRYIKKCMKKIKRTEKLEISTAALLSKVYDSEAKDNISAIFVEV